MEMIPDVWSAMEAPSLGGTTLMVAVVLIALYTVLSIRFIGQGEQLVIELLTKVETVEGPRVVLLPLLRKKWYARKAISLSPTEYVVITNRLEGGKKAVKGPNLLFLGPHDEWNGEKRNVISLKKNEFVRLLDKQTGKVRVERGEKVIVPQPFENILDPEGVRTALALKVYEYVRIENKATGSIRIERGEQLVYLDEHEEAVGGVQRAVEIDEETAVVIRNKRTGQQELVTEKQIFIPRSDTEILSVRKLIKLANYEACIVRGKDGTDEFFFGKNAHQRAFFLGPYSEIVQLVWSRGRRREFRDLIITKIDMRPMYMSFEFNCRTADNVELILEGTFFWEVVDLEAMFRATGDTSGDVCAHARSKFIELVSKITLPDFMRDFNTIAEAVEWANDNFYSMRGVHIHSLEVTGYRCAEESTAVILRQIVQETTNRINRLQQQESENEWQLLELKGNINEERARAELLEVQVANSAKLSQTEGLAEAQRVQAFLEGLAEQVPDISARIALWNVLRKKDALAEVCKTGSGARLYYTPSDVNLSIEDRSGCAAQCAAHSDAGSGCKL